MWLAFHLAVMQMLMLYNSSWVLLPGQGSREFFLGDNWNEATALKFTITYIYNYNGALARHASC